MDLHEIIKKLVGPIHPIGEQHVDDDRYGNLRQLTELVDKLVFDIDQVYRSYQHNHQASMKRASDFAGVFLDDLGVRE